MGSISAEDLSRVLSVMLQEQNRLEKDEEYARLLSRTATAGPMPEMWRREREEVEKARRARRAAATGGSSSQFPAPPPLDHHPLPVSEPITVKIGWACATSTQCGEFTHFIKKIEQKRVGITVHLERGATGTTVAELRALIEEKTNVPARNQQLIYHGKMLQGDDLPLSAWNTNWDTVKDHSYFHLAPLPELTAGVQREEKDGENEEDAEEWKGHEDGDEEEVDSASGNAKTTGALADSTELEAARSKLAAMSVKDMKAAITQFGLSFRDCITKADIRQRAQEVAPMMAAAMAAEVSLAAAPAKPDVDDVDLLSDPDSDSDLPDLVAINSDSAAEDSSSEAEPEESKAAGFHLPDEIIRAAGCGNVQVVEEWLQSSDGNVNAQAVDNSTLLMRAALHDRYEVVQLLLRENVAVNQQDQRGVCALMLAAAEGRVTIVSLLVEEGRADIDMRDVDGKTALMRAAIRGRLTTVERLLAAGADPSSTDINGRTAKDHAKESGYDDVKKVIKKAAKQQQQQQQQQQQKNNEEPAGKKKKKRRRKKKKTPKHATKDVNDPEDGRWTCGTCTFINRNPDHLQCEMCLTPRERDDFLHNASAAAAASAVAAAAARQEAEAEFERRELKKALKKVKEAEERERKKEERDEETREAAAARAAAAAAEKEAKEAAAEAAMAELLKEEEEKEAIAGSKPKKSKARAKKLRLKKKRLERRRRRRQPWRPKRKRKKSQSQSRRRRRRGRRRRPGERPGKKSNVKSARKRRGKKKRRRLSSTSERRRRYDRRIVSGRRRAKMRAPKRRCVAWRITAGAICLRSKRRRRVASSANWCAGWSKERRSSGRGSGWCESGCPSSSGRGRSWPSSSAHWRSWPSGGRRPSGRRCSRRRRRRQYSEMQREKEKESCCRRQ